MVKDSLNLRGKIIIKNLSRDIPDVIITNLITANGFSLYMDRLMDNSVAFIDYIGIGDGIGTHTVTSTTLYNEIFRKQTDSKTNPGAIANFNFVILGNEALGSWTELGLFNDAVAGSLTNVVEQTYIHIAGDNLAISWDIISS